MYETTIYIIYLTNFIGVKYPNKIQNLQKEIKQKHKVIMRITLKSKIYSLIINES